MRTLLDYFLHRIRLYVQQKNLAAAKIQALVQRFILKRRLIRQNKAAIVIQTSWRGHAARETLRMLKQEQLLALQNAAAAVIQVCSGFDMKCLGQICSNVIQII